jgi:hypothetical protein
VFEYDDDLAHKENMSPPTNTDAASKPNFTAKAENNRDVTAL